MKDKCYRCRFQPLLLVYTNPAGLPVDAKHAPKLVNIVSKEKLLETPVQSPTHRKVKKRKSKKGHRSRSNSPADVLNKTNELDNSLISIHSQSPSSSAKNKNKKRTSDYDPSREKNKLIENGSVNRTFNGPNQLPSTGARFLNGTTGQIQHEIQHAVVRESYSDNTITNKKDSGKSDLSNNVFDNTGNHWERPGTSKTKSRYSKTKNKYFKSKSDNNDSFDESCSSIKHKDFDVSSLDNLTLNDWKNMEAQGQNESRITNGISSRNKINGHPQQEIYRGNHQQNYSQDASLQEELHPKHSESNDISLRDIKPEDSDKNLNSVDQNDKTFNVEKMKKNHDANLMEFAETEYDMKSVRQNGIDTDLIHFNSRPEVFHETRKQGI